MNREDRKCKKCCKYRSYADFPKYHRTGCTKEKRRGVCKECFKKQTDASRYKLMSDIRHLMTQRVKGARKRAKTKGFACEVDTQYLVDLYDKQEGLCAITGMKMSVQAITSSVGMCSDVVSLDRIDSSIGYLKGNVQLVCSDINIMKGTKNMDELIKSCISILKNNKENDYVLKALSTKS